MTLREVLGLSALLSLLLCVYFWRVVFAGNALAPADMLFEFPFFRAAAPSTFQHAANPLLSDAVLKFYPWQTVTREAVHTGRMPFWNPYIFCGAPLFANAESAVLYPINLVGYWLSLRGAAALSAMLRMFVGGLGAFLFLRALQVQRFGAVVSAVAFMFGGSMTVWQNYPVGNAYAWTPLLYFAGERLLVSRHPWYVALTSWTIAAHILGGHYQTSFIMFLGWSLYCGYRVFDRVRRGRCAQPGSTLMLLAGAVVLGFMLAAVQLLPFWEWLGQTNEQQIRMAERAARWFDPDFPKSVVTALVTLVLPNFFGNPTWGSAMSFLHSNYVEQMVYMGIVPLLLAIAAVLGIRSHIDEPAGEQGGGLRRTGLVIFFAVSGLLFLTLAVPLPGIGLVHHLPVFDLIATPRYRLGFTFCVAVLAGMGAESLFASRSRGVRGTVLAAALLIAAGGALLLGAARWVLIAFKSTVTAYQRILTLYPLMLAAYSPATLSMYVSLVIALGFAGLLVLHRRSWLSARSAMTLLLGLVVVDLFTFGMTFNPTIPPSQVFPSTAAVRFLQERLAAAGPARMVALNDDLPANVGMPYRFSEIAGSDFPSRRYLELALAMGGRLIGHNRISFSALEPRFLNLLNVKYVVASAPPAFASLREVYRDPAVGVYENPGSLPRAYVARRVKTLREERAILDALQSADFDPANDIILEESPPLGWSHDSVPSDDRVRVLEYQPEHVRIEATLASSGFLFLSDAYQPGWDALVDAQPAKIYRADYAFRAVYLAEGQHVIEFAYTAPGFKLGLAITLGGIIVSIALLVAGCRRPWRQAA